MKSSLVLPLFLLALLDALPAHAQQIQEVRAAAAGATPHEVAWEKRLKADAAYRDCRKSGAACDAERAAFVLAGDEVDAAIVAEMRANTERMVSATRGLEVVNARLSAYAACRRAHRRWQFWRRCHY